jgi:transposase
MGWAPIGQRCYAEKKAERTTRYNIIAALNSNSLFAPFIFEGYSNTDVYEAYVTQVLVPALKPGMVVIIDNASFHKPKRIRDIIEAAGSSVIFLPPYTPEFNPIEHYWSPIKKDIRRVVADTKDFFKAAVQVMEKRCMA